MGMILNGTWINDDKVMTNGSYFRPKTAFRSQINWNDAAISQGRFSLFISASCPWCHRVSIVHKLKKLENVLPLHIVGGPRIQGYALAGGDSCAIAGLPDPAQHLHELYTASDPNFTGRSTIPVLWDNINGKIINNESSDIIRLLNDFPNPKGIKEIDLCPPSLQQDINNWNDKIYSGLNNAVYQAGFAEQQAAYETAVQKVFQTLDLLEQHLSNRHYMVGERLTETDCRLYPTLVRFDPVYHSHFKCSLKRIADYPALGRYLDRLDQKYDLRDTVDMQAIRHAYFHNDRTINPSGIVPLPPFHTQPSTAELVS